MFHAHPSWTVESKEMAQIEPVAKQACGSRGPKVKAQPRPMFGSLRPVRRSAGLKANRAMKFYSFGLKYKL